MEYVKSFRDLEVYKLSRQLSKEIFEATKKFPKEYLLTQYASTRENAESINILTHHMLQLLITNY